MSKGKIGYSVTTTEQSLEETRRREAEAVTRRLGAIASTVAAQQGRYSHLVGHLDEARVRLPDLAFAVPTLPSAPAGDNLPAGETYAAELMLWVGRLEREAEAAIAAATIALQRRQALAQTWSELYDGAAELLARNAVCRKVSQELHAAAELEEPVLPERDATLEDAQAALQRLKAQLMRCQAQQIGLERRRQARQTAGTLTGQGVHATTAAQRLDGWTCERAAVARRDAQRAVTEALDRAVLTVEALPVAIQLQVQQAIDHASGHDHTLRVTDLIARHRVRLDGMAHAHRLLAAPPAYTEPELLTRWQNLVRRLEMVACGHEDFSNTLALEYGQIHSDATRAVQRAYAKAAFLDAGIEAGFQIIETDDLVLMELDQFPAYWVEVRQEPCADGYATLVQLKAEPSADPSNDAAVMDSICHKLQMMANPSDATVESAVKVIEHASLLPRSKRPARPRAKAFAASLNPTKS